MKAACENAVSYTHLDVYKRQMCVLCRAARLYCEHEREVANISTFLYATNGRMTDVT